MNKFKKGFFAIILGALSIISNAEEQSNIKITANLNSGCQINANNISFGVVEEMYKIVAAPMNIRCSKNVVADIRGSDKNNPTPYWGPRMWRVGASSDRPETRIRYAVSTYAIESNKDIEVIKMPHVNYLWHYISGNGSDYNLVIKFLSGENTVLNFNGVIEQYSAGTTQSTNLILFNSKEIIPGEYTDDFTYNVNF